MNTMTRFGLGATITFLLITSVGAIGLAAGNAGYGRHGQEELTRPVVCDCVSSLSDTEAHDVLFMREEEKVARDVYLAMASLSTNQIFSNISQSEQKHMDALQNVIEKYGLIDPVGNNGVGVFTNSELQGLYDALIVQGSVSVIDALTVGAAIEEIDILDLRECLERTDNIDIQRVYQNLIRGSENHLRAFVNALEVRGLVYEPQYLSIAEYNLIIN